MRNLHSKRILLLFLIIIPVFFFCSPPKYIPMRQSKITMVDLDNSIVNYIPIDDYDLDKSKILDSTYGLIINKQLSKLSTYINSLEQSGINSSDLYLSKTLLLITKKDYTRAVQSIRKINDSDYPMLKQLLSIDINYEIAKINGAKNYNGFLKDYQNLVDAFPDNVSLKKLVAIRLRYLRYNY